MITRSASKKKEWSEENHSVNAGQRRRRTTVLPAIRDKMDLHSK